MDTVFSNSASLGYNLNGKVINVNSNTVISTLVNNITMIKTQSDLIMFPTTIQTYTIVCSNASILNYTNAIFTDIIPTGLEYIANSFKMDGVLKTPVLTGNTLTYNVGNWSAGISHTFVFQCQRSI